MSNLNLDHTDQNTVQEAVNRFEKTVCQADEKSKILLLILLLFILVLMHLLSKTSKLSYLMAKYISRWH